MLEIEVLWLTLPTYQRGPDSPFPALTFSGRRPGRRPVYPYPLQDDIDAATMVRQDGCRHRAVRLSNGILEALVLPGMNGRLYSLRNLADGRELFYRNHVVKPGLVALRGAWLSGGIEFNFPTLGHTVSTVSPVFWRLEQSAAEVAVVVGDLDRSTRQRWEVRMALARDRAALDVHTTLANPNPYRERLYYWENAAVPATDDLRFVCRCDWTVGSVSQPFPLRQGRDLSLHPNNPLPVDHFGYRSYADFFGAYYPATQYGTYHIAPRLSLPGQKYFTWGTGEDDLIWQRYLTDADGPYVEIQAGVLETQWITDWLQAGEVVRASGRWFGTAEMGEVTWATPELALAAEAAENDLRLSLYSIAVEGRADVCLENGSRQHRQSLVLGTGRTTHVDLPDLRPATLTIRGQDGRLLLRETWHRATDGARDPARDPQPPTQWAMRDRRETPLGKAAVAMQFHRWAEAERILEEATAADVRQDREALGVERYLKTDRPESALARAREALASYPGHLGIHALAAAAAARLHRLHGGPDAEAALRDHALAARRGPALAAPLAQLLAEAEIRSGRLHAATRILDAVLDMAPDTEDARILLSAALRHGGARQAAAHVLERQPIPLTPARELESWLLHGEGSPRPCLPDAPVGQDWGETHAADLLLEPLFTYWRVALLDDVERLLEALAESFPRLADHPHALLLRMDAAAARNDDDQAREWALRASRACVDWVAPSRWEEACLLQRAMARLGPGEHGVLPYLLGLYRAEHDAMDAAVALLRQACETPAAAGPARGLAAKALADWAEGIQADASRAAAFLRQALQCFPGDRRLLLQLDECLRHRHRTRERLELWRQAPSHLRERGDVTCALARLDLDLGQ
ncbi:MAG: DUF5107 domain-containing protein, partial [Lentisphaeria bacterium]|nr:DUF5107 domain-containing protein [Lentisphaeria bacterium]